MDLMVIAFVCMFIGGLLVFMIMYFAGTQFARAILMRRLGKNIGIVTMVTAGNYEFSTLKNFDDDLLKSGDKAWVFEKGKIYRQVADEGEIKTKENIDIQKFMTTKAGVPKFYCSPDDMLPLKMWPDPIPKGVNRQPASIAQAINKERTVFKALVLKAFGGDLKTWIMIATICAVLGMAISAVGAFNTMGINSGITTVNGTVNNIQYLLTEGGVKCLPGGI